MFSSARLVAEMARRTSLTPTGCLEWSGLRDAQGYGRIYVGKRKVALSHRVAWILGKGDIPTGSCVLHRCDNPPCVNVDHLFLGTRGDNIRDMASKGRQWLQQRPECRPVCPPELMVRGERHHSAKLSDSDVLAIRHRFAAGGVTKRSMAREYGVSENTIGSTLSGALKRHLAGPLFPRGRAKRCNKQ